MSATKSSHAFRRFGVSAESLARSARDVETLLSALPIGAYLLLIVVAIGLLLLLSGDFGEFLGYHICRAEGPGGL